MPRKQYRTPKNGCKIAILVSYCQLPIHIKFVKMQFDLVYLPDNKFCSCSWVADKVL